MFTCISYFFQIYVVLGNNEHILFSGFNPVASDCGLATACY